MIRPINKNEIPGRITSYNNLVEQDIDMFLESDMEAAEIDPAKYKAAIRIRRLSCEHQAQRA